MKPLTLEDRLLKRIDRKRGDVFLRSDFNDLGGYPQVSRVLRQLVDKGQLVKIGQGLYARTRLSMVDGKPAPVKSLRALTTEALARLGIESMPTQFEQAYSAGLTTQVPSGRQIGVAKRVRRKIGYNGVTMSFERA